MYILGIAGVSTYVYTEPSFLRASRVASQASQDKARDTPGLCPNRPLGGVPFQPVPESSFPNLKINTIKSVHVIPFTLCGIITLLKGNYEITL